MNIRFEVPGEVKSKQRARGYRNQVTGKPVFVTPEDTVNYENWVKVCFLDKNRNFTPYDGALEVNIVAYFKQPKTNKHAHATSVRLDCDNIAKAICDALNKIAYNDDKQIVKLAVQKKWGLREMAEITIKSAEFEF